MALSSVASQTRDAQNELMNSLSALHVGRKYSDLTIQCNYKKWAVHKAIVCSRSGFFDGACSYDFREHQTGIIDLSEDDEDAVEQMIHYFYNLDYLNQEPASQPSAVFRHRAYSDARRRPQPKVDFTQIEDPLLAQAGLYSSRNSLTPPGSSLEYAIGDSMNGSPQQSPRSRNKTPLPEAEGDSDGGFEEEYESTESGSHLILHAQVYALAEKYDVPSLKQLARQKFEVAAACYYDAPELADAISCVYTSTVDIDRGLRDVVLQLFKAHPQVASTQDIYAVIKESPNLTLDLFKVERGLL